jgi:serine protease Do
MKKITFALLACGLLPFTGKAQEEKKEIIIEKRIDDGKAEDDKKVKKETQEIIIRKNGEKDVKLKVEIDGDNITINGKPMSEFKDKDITINKRKMIITDGDNVMNWNFKGDAGDWEKWGETFGENFSRNFNGGWNEESEQDGAFLGVTTENDKEGAKIITVSKGSAAEKAGLQKDDIITKIGEEKIAGPEALSDVVGFKKPSEEVKVTYKRNGKVKTATATLGKRKTTKSHSFGGAQPRVFSFRSPAAPMPPNMEGFSEELSELQDNAIMHAFPGRKKIGLKIQDTEESNGVKVMNVEDSSAAATAGLKKDDIITEINGKKITNTDEAREELFPDEQKNTYKIKANRAGSEMTFDVKIPKKLKTANL